MADLDKNIARTYGVLLNDSVALRGLFLIDKEGIVRHSVINDLPLGRNVSEALRILWADRSAPATQQWWASPLVQQ